MKIKQVIPLLIVLFGILLRYFSIWCIDSIGACYGSWLHQIFPHFVKPLYLFSLVALPIGIVLVFVKEEVFKSWLKFAVWWIPLSALVIALTPTTSNSWMPLYDFVKEDVAWLMGGLFALVSIVIIVWKIFALKKKS